ncbi:30S ribosomal protein S17e [Candidatus Woesearchaeota archaeon]|nr:30S ribosomal protein S17e [Candidatus Woesearchaeota archaeon]
MGRIKTTLVKRTTEELLEKHGGDFSTDFKENKAKVAMFIKAPSKKIRNIIAGYITRNKKRQEVATAS